MFIAALSVIAKNLEIIQMSFSKWMIKQTVVYPLHWMVLSSNRGRDTHNVRNKYTVSESHSVVSDSLQPHGLYSPWNSVGQHIRMRSLSLDQSPENYAKWKKPSPKRLYKGPSSQGYGFSSGHVWMRELDYKESWVLKNWCFWTVVLEKTLESPLDCKEIQPVHPKGDQSWVFIGRTDVEAETPILWPPDVKSWPIWKDPDAGKD